MFKLLFFFPFAFVQNFWWQVTETQLELYYVITGMQLELRGSGSPRLEQQNLPTFSKSLILVSFS